MPRAIASRIPIRITVPVLLLLPVLLVALTLSAIAYLHGRASTRDLVAREMSQIHDRIAGYVGELLSAPRRITELNASLIAQGALPRDDLAAWRRTLVAQMRAYDMLSTVAWGDREGRAVWVCRYVGDDLHTYWAVKETIGRGPMREYRVDASGTVSDEPSSVFDFDPRVRPWYEAPMQAGGPAWCEPYVWVGGGDASVPTLGLSFGQPFRDDGGEIVGVVDSDLSLVDISRYLSRLRTSESGAVYLIDEAGRVVASSSGAMTAGADGHRIAARDSEQSWLAAGAAHLESTYGTVAAFAAGGVDGELASAGHRETLEVDGARVFLMASPLVHPTGLRWVVLTIVPESDFLGAVVAARRRSIAIGAIICALTIGLGLLAASFLVRPVLALTKHVRRIGEGRLDEELHLDQSPELARLSAEINRMTAGLRDRMRLRHSLALAMDVQQALLPSDSPRIDGLDVAGHSTYCDETGGDYFDFLDIEGSGQSSVIVALGDVMGHGAAAAMLMATARGILRSRAREAGSLAELLGHMNALLVPDTGGRRFMTMLLATLDPAAGTLRWASAGHDPPFVYDPRPASPDAEHVELEGSGLPLGIVADEIYHEHVFTGVRPGQVLFLATDGVWEMQNAEGEFFGKDRVRELLGQWAEESAEEIGARIREALKRFRGDETQDDDVTFVVIRVL